MLTSRTALSRRCQRPGNDDNNGFSVDRKEELIRKIMNDDPKIKIAMLSFSKLVDCNASFMMGNTYVTTLHLVGNSINNLNFMIGNTTLTLLEIGKNHIQDISPLKGNVTLERLYITNNFIQDISPLKDNQTLISLYISDNYIKDVTPLYDNLSIVNFSMESNQSDITRGSIGELYRRFRINALNYHNRNCTMHQLLFNKLRITTFDI
jgi:Leucine-rich repeat (LRR) protein